MMLITILIAILPSKLDTVPKNIAQQFLQISHILLHFQIFERILPDMFFSLTNLPHSLPLSNISNIWKNIARYFSQIFHILLEFQI